MNNSPPYLSPNPLPPQLTPYNNVKSFNRRSLPKTNLFPPPQLTPYKSENSPRQYILNSQPFSPFPPQKLNHSSPKKTKTVKCSPEQWPELRPIFNDIKKLTAKLNSNFTYPFWNIA